ncbi:MAG TPA: helix-turn-helix domain-containing protein [Archangium sp.]|uniref:AraC family transcriptional regulator n=1 Tax=Archangium sp. TaxID=1872627 RepID=UPI002E311EC8|nr:helix-turn-helix domain-containing protein [Archangium sp.]HEX5751753.1 helix-turn-helix domain-containing protein [Archangium sp.]
MSSPRKLRTLIGTSTLIQVEAGVAFGVSLEEAAAVGLDVQALRVPEARASAEAVYTHLELVASRGPIEPYVVEQARRHGSSASLGLMSLLIKTCSTARHAMNNFLRYERLANELVTSELTEQDSRAILTEHRHGPDRPGAQVASEVWALCSVAICRRILGEQLCPIALEVRRSGVQLGPYQDFLRCEVREGAPRARLIYDSHWLDLPLPGADPELATYLEQQARARFEATAARGTLVLEVRRLLREQLTQGSPSMASVARRLALSTRSLQRRLGEEGTSYEQVLDELRAEVARAYLTREDLSVAEVGFLLGFQDSSSFHRACRRWFGTTPTRLRAPQEPEPPSRQRSTRRPGARPGESS